MPPETAHADIEAAFAAALLDPGLPPPAGLLAPDGGPIGRRFAVHRATTGFALIGALAGRFPATERLLGTGTFADLARAFLGVDRPRTAVLLDWGEALPDFIETLPDLAEWPYLADVARLEVAWARAHHAAEAVSIGLADLACVTPAMLAEARIVLHPSAGLFASPFPVATLWARQQAEADAGEMVWSAEAVLVVRPEADVLLHRLTPAAHAFVAALAQSRDVTAAALAAVAIDPGFDTGDHLVALVRLGAVTAFASPFDPETSA